MEYDYAVEIGKPVIRLLHKDPFNKLTGDRIERTDDGKAKLTAFRSKMSQSSLVNFWDDPKELGKLVVLGLIDMRKRHPAVGWVPGNQIASEAALITIADLRHKLAELELVNERYSTVGGVTARRDNAKQIILRAFGEIPVELEDPGAAILGRILHVARDNSNHRPALGVTTVRALCSEGDSRSFASEQLNDFLRERKETLGAVLNAIATLGLIRFDGVHSSITPEGERVLNLISSGYLLED